MIPRTRSTGFRMSALAAAALLGMALMMSMAATSAKATYGDRQATETTADTISAASTGVAADIAVGTNFACAATQAGHVSCWGNNQYGQLGNDTSGNIEPYPVRVKGGEQGGKWLTGVIQLAAGGDHMCALTDDGSLFCWGRNQRGQLGTGSQRNAAEPEQVNLASVTSVAAGLKNTCAIAGGNAYCWGDNLYGQVGVNQTPAGSPANCSSTGSALSCAKTPQQIELPGVAQISVGFQTVCAIAASKVYCWGSNINGALGCGESQGSSYRPVEVCAPGKGTGSLSEAGTPSAVAAGWDYGCAVVNGSVFCWGNNTFGELGIGDQRPNGQSNIAIPPTQVAAGEQSRARFLTEASTIATSDSNKAHSCAQTSTGMFCWGDSKTGELGNGTTSTSFTPVRVLPGEEGFGAGGSTAISVGASDTCAINSESMPYCWGSNQLGQLGKGDFAVENCGTTRKAVPCATTARLVEGQLMVSPSSVDFGTVKPGTKNQEDVTARSTFLYEVASSAEIREGKTTGFSWQGCSSRTAQGSVVDPDEDCKGTVKFAPEKDGTYGGQITIKTWVNEGTVDNPVQGLRVGPNNPFAAAGRTDCVGNCGPVLAAKPNPVDFGTVDVGDVKSAKTTLSNIGDKPLTITKLKVKDAQDEFDIKNASPCKTTLEPGGKCKVSVRFFPRVAGSAAARMVITSNSDLGDDSVALAGEGKLVITPDKDGNLEPPSKVRKLKAPSNQLKCRSATITWQKPKDSGSAPVNGYQTRIKKNGDWKKWKNLAWVPDKDGNLSYTYKNLKPNTGYKVQVRAESIAGTGKRKTTKFTTPRCSVPIKPGNG